MKLEAVDPGELRIDAYGGGGFRIDGERHEGAVIVHPERGVCPWDLSVEEPDAAFNGLLSEDAGIELLIVGTGAALVAVEPGLRAAFEAKGIAIEGMPTPSACRTYNILLAEQRRVAAALMPV